MQKQFRFTTTNLRALPANPAGAKATELEFSDTDVVGLKCLSGKTDSKRFLLRYTFLGRKASISIGRFPDVDLASARNIARYYKTLVAQGVDPKTKRDERSAERAVPTVSEFFHQTYLPLAKKRKRTWDADISRFRLCRSIHNIPYDKLTAQDVLNVQLSLSSASKGRDAYAAATCNRALAVLKTMGKQAEDYLGIPNVAARVSLLPENNARTRYCNIEETKKIISAALAYPCRSSGAYIALLFLMGCRASELRVRKWDDIDLANRTLRIPRTKNGSYHIIYLSDFMVEIIQSVPRLISNPYLFPGAKLGKPIGDARYAFNSIKETAGIPNPDEVVFHTARHSVASNLISSGTDISAVQKLLNHRSIESTLRYAKLSEAKQRQTTQHLSDMIQHVS